MQTEWLTTTQIIQCNVNSYLFANNDKSLEFFLFAKDFRLMAMTNGWQRNGRQMRAAGNTLARLYDKRK